MAEERHICALLRQGCGGCPLLETPYPEQLRQKQARVEALLGEFGPVSPSWGWSTPGTTATRPSPPSAPGRAGGWTAAFTPRAPTGWCRWPPACSTTPPWTRRWRRCGRPPGSAGTSPTRRTGARGLSAMCWCATAAPPDGCWWPLVTAAPVLPGARAFVSKVRELCPRVETIVQNINPRRSSAVLGPREKVLWGRGYVEDTLCGVRFRLGASSFYQINPEQTEVLYRTALDGAGLDGTQTVVDAYCGVGTIGLAAAGRARRVLGGVQPQRGPVRRPERPGQRRGQRPLPLRRRHGLPPGHGRPGRAGGRGVPGPARAGSTPEFLGAVDRMGPERIVYISCNPETQRRDLRLLAGWGWRARLLQPVDLFPHTEHVECVAVLAKIRGGGM